MKKIINLVLLLAPMWLAAQSLYISDIGNNLYSIDITTCEYEFITEVNAQVYDIAFHPDGTLYGISGSGRFYSINEATGQVTDIFDFEGQTYNSLTVTGSGEVFTIGSNGQLYGYNPATNSERYYGNIGYQPTGDLTFYQGGLYVAVTLDRIVRINLEVPSSSVVVIDENIEGSIFGIVSFAEDDCRLVTPIAITDGNSSLYTIDFDSLTLTFLCELDITVTGGASTFEFFASNPASIDSVVIVPTSCNEANGSITVSGNSDAMGLEFSINGTDFQPDSVFTSLPAGQIEVTMQDVNGCSDSTTVVIPNSAGVTIVSIEVQQATCGLDNGQITINTEGAIGNVMYSINNGQSFVDVATLSGLPVGTYQIVVEDEASCTATDEVSVIELPGVEITDIVAIPATCDLANGSLTVNTTEGAITSYALDQGTPQSEPRFQDLADNTYTVALTDANGCIDSMTATVPKAPTVRIDSVLITDATCGLTNGRLVVEASLENCQYTIDGQNYQPSDTFAGLDRGMYTITVRDINECQATAEAEIVGPDPLIIAEADVLGADCGRANGSVTVSLEVPVESVTVFTSDSNKVSGTFLEGLDIGLQTVVVEDENGCTASIDITVEEGDCPFTVPNVFSPNGDGVNDELLLHFHPNFKGSLEHFDIYDRYGNKVLTYADQASPLPPISWNGIFGGQQASIGVYTYRLLITRRDGTPEQHIGTITLLR